MKHPYANAWYTRKTVKPQKMFARYGEGIEIEISTCFTIFIAVVVFSEYSNALSKVISLSWQVAVGVTGVVATVVTIGFAVEKDYYVFFSTRDLLESMNIARKLFAALLFMIITAGASVLSTIFSENPASSWLSCLTVGVLVINLYYNVLLVFVLLKGVFSGKNEDGDLLGMLYKVFDIRAIDARPIRNKEYIKKNSLRALMIIIYKYFEIVRKLKINELKSMQVCLNYDDLDDLVKRKWIRKYMKRWSVAYLIICLIGLSYCYSNDAFGIVSVKIVLIVYAAFYMLSFVMSKYVNFYQQKIIDMFCGTYGYSICYTEKENIVVGINTNPMLPLGKDKKWTDYINTRNNIVAMFWILSQSLECKYLEETYTYLFDNLSDIIKKETSIYPLFPFYAADFFVWRSLKCVDSIKHHSILGQRELNEKEKKYIESELFVLLRFKEDNADSFKKDLEKYYDSMN